MRTYDPVNPIMEPAPLAIALSLVIALDTCAFSQDSSNQSKSGLNEHVSTPHSHLAAMRVGGEAVADIGNSC